MYSKPGIRFAALFCMVMAALAAMAQDELRLPSSVLAGTGISIPTSGSGAATLYVIGPDRAIKQQTSLGTEISLSAEDLQTAGRYVVLLCTQSCRSTALFVTAAKVQNLGFLVHPSRVPAGQPQAISGVAFPFDKFHNLIVSPLTVNVRLNVGDAVLMSHSFSTAGGVAWFRENAGARAGVVNVTASTGDVSVHRVVQEVAADPCNLRIAAQRNAKWISVETEPLRDCAGNPVQDGTIVTFTATGPKGKSTVDAPVKQGIARAQIMASGAAVISAASGVVMGNELRVGPQ